MKRSTTMTGTQSVAAFSRRRRRGSVLVEFAFVITILLLLTLGLVQYSLIASTSMSLSQLAREGARFAAINPKSDAIIKKRIEELSATYNIPYTAITNITITPKEGDRDKCKSIEVSLSYDMRKRLFAPGLIPGGSFTKTSSAAFMIEGSDNSCL